MRFQLFPPWSRPGEVELVQPSKHKPNEAQMLLPPWLRPGDGETIQGHSASEVELDRAFQLVPPWSRPGVSALDAGFLWLLVPPWARPGDVALDRGVWLRPSCLVEAEA
jgi:hypothetical protein